MDILSSPIPQISISLAPPEEALAEPYSPFAKSSFNLLSHHDDDDAFRPLHLTPPPTSTKFVRLNSPLRASQTDAVPAKQTGKGLDRARFEALLNSTKEKPPAVKKDAVDLRKEVALKAHKSKQAGRRALFLSKVLAPPTSAAAVTPKTPPESPAIFHYRLPSPGLVSPIAHYESLHIQEGSEDSLTEPYVCQPWVEQVDFKLLRKEDKPRARTAVPRQRIPSLEQITARLNPHRTPEPEQRASQTATPGLSVQQTPRLVIGRLRMPIRNSTTPTIKISFPDEDEHHDEYSTTGPPKSPLLTTPSDLEVTTLVVSRTRSVSPTELTKVNLLALNSRETRSSAMLSTLRRRTQSSSFCASPSCPSPISHETDRKSFRRHSAPPESMSMSYGRRSGFEHPVLRLPGAF